ncbi:MGMT family protein [Marinomonas mediterranea]|jgi:O(6)-alkylguanine repair protein YbaZ|uniref:Methylated-DNA-(Protein)-cysteine S-methyltransferase DNA binding protein n=1 Tax=Marinomonas mediterranea (strain ATCC 700492 / JCM 21426 / NBRC 103028 / MMB-1) TaxID=717774 RepID=F2K3H1_MARM1|nr:MGMT family protein [Marinomonas mediterranea]ADZ91313.1 Methylated-DNA-(protein)-cysteine S-methyltransferase DNA binding protein [Marinomonas mediterranea MMB-1]WCN09284.1 cysteine methyltransferase [Marinomonas mediterranea]WCN13366.1 cysteine methyltransferase [Marinomonas mediterranea]WCN17434.1 cysteine methyltransferase [Marinomonas mediterranea MMB-1]
MTNQEQQDFKSQVFLLLSSSDAGDIFSYGQLAKLAGAPRHARLVGRILRELPKKSTLPWHRVINARKMISFPENSEAYNRQRERLEAEGWVITGQKLLTKEESK